jgi:hypothetical protein
MKAWVFNEEQLMAALEEESRRYEMFDENDRGLVLMFLLSDAAAKLRVGSLDKGNGQG